MLASGTVLQNRYQILRLLGQGGMGAVYQARALALGDKSVAVKENVGGDPRQFRQEVAILASLSHPNLPRVVDHFIQPNNVQYLVMDFVEGEDLDSLVQRQGALPEAQVLAWLDQILDAVAYLHSHGVIHRDIKPANIKITPAGQAVLVDFGIAKIFQSGQSTMTGAKAGTPGFAAPEQYLGGTDRRSDIYALGATAYTLLTGSAPPDARSLQTRSGILTPPHMLNAAISAQTERAIMHAMEVQSDHRFQTAEEMRRALQAAYVAPNMAQTLRQSTLPVPKGQRNYVPIIGLTAMLGLLLLLCGVGAFWAVNRVSATPTRLIALATETQAPIAMPVFVVPTEAIVSPTVAATIAPSLTPVKPTMTNIRMAPVTASSLRSTPTATASKLPTTEPTQTALASGMKYIAPEPISGTVRQVSGQVSLEWKSVAALAPNEKYLVEITGDNVVYSEWKWDAEAIVCSILTRDAKLVLPPTNSPPCSTYIGFWEGYKRFWWHDDYNYAWRISLVETDGAEKILRRISDYGGGYILWSHQ